jgi:hypothetical protein
MGRFIGFLSRLYFYRFIPTQLLKQSELKVWQKIASRAKCVGFGPQANLRLLWKPVTRKIFRSNPVCWLQISILKADD